MADASGRLAWAVWDSNEGGSGYTWPLPANTTCTDFLGGACSVANGAIAIHSTPVYVIPRM
jgi:hypothetical protein